MAVSYNGQAKLLLRIWHITVTQNNGADFGFIFSENYYLINSKKQSQVLLINSMKLTQKKI